ncbi:MAG: hypothetical protein J5552_00380 [Prevotella sp.]|nr:hypothetical protein [Prevotella sp.]
MIIVYNLHNAFKRSQLEISSEASYHLLTNYLLPYKKEKLPVNVTFEVATGKKAYDIIRLFQSGEFFFSQKFIDVLSSFIDMSEKCYPIMIDGLEKQYYVIYNLEKLPYLNKEKAMFDEEPSFYCGKEITAPLFGVDDTRCFVVTEEIKNAIMQNNISNVYFEESFLCTEKEYEVWHNSQK